MTTTTRHIVTFYSDDDALTADVTNHVAGSVARSQPAVVIATASHRDAVVESLAGYGIQPGLAAGGQQVLLLDAATTLEQFMIDNRPSPQLFRASVGQIIGDTFTGGSGWAFGEMVGLLWDSGNVEAALELERLWHELLAEVNFELRCGYPATLLREASLRELTDVCHRHDEFVAGACEDDDAASAVFLPAPSAAAAARHFVARHADHHARVDDLLLVTSELVTNAIRHAATAFRISLRPAGRGLRVEVEDASSDPPAPARSSLSALGGRGLAIIESLSETWGNTATVAGKIVWAEVAA